MITILHREGGVYPDPQKWLRNLWMTPKYEIQLLQNAPSVYVINIKSCTSIIHHHAYFHRNKVKVPNSQLVSTQNSIVWNCDRQQSSITVSHWLLGEGHFGSWILITFDNVGEVGAVMRYIIQLSRGEVSDLLPLISPAQALWQSIHSPNLPTTFHPDLILISSWS